MGPVGPYSCFKFLIPRAPIEESMRRFRRSELKHATDNFSNDKVIGSGGFGTVYEGVLIDGAKIAVKRSDPCSRQGLKEFHTEIEICSRLRHCNVVPLLGYCDKGGEMALVYEHMGQGNLSSHLYGDRSGSCLTWIQRLRILQGAGRGLHYLHTGTEKGTIHLDVKTSNILLDDNLNAKIGDMGLAKVVPLLEQSHVTISRVKGTPGCWDPESFKTHQVTRGSDVYGFGVVMAEALTGRQAVDTELPDEQKNLALWVKTKLKDEAGLQGIVDPRIAGEIRRDTLRVFDDIVGRCLADDHKNRPSMEYVLGGLEVVLEMQQQVPPPDDGTTPGAFVGVVGNSMELTSLSVQKDGASASQAPPPPKQSSEISINDTNMLNEANSPLCSSGSWILCSVQGKDESSMLSDQDIIEEEAALGWMTDTQDMGLER